MSENDGNILELIEQKITFIIDQQANCLAGLERVKMFQARTDARLDRATRLGVREARRKQVRRTKLAKKLDALIDTQCRAEAQLSRLRAAQSQAETELVALREVQHRAEAKTADLLAGHCQPEKARGRAKAETVALCENSR